MIYTDKNNYQVNQNKNTSTLNIDDDNYLLICFISIPFGIFFCIITIDIAVKYIIKKSMREQRDRQNQYIEFNLDSEEVGGNTNSQGGNTNSQGGNTNSQIIIQENTLQNNLDNLTHHQNIIIVVEQPDGDIYLGKV